jgi:hypothetical protein
LLNSLDRSGSRARRILFRGETALVEDLLGRLAKDGFSARAANIACPLNSGDWLAARVDFPFSMRHNVFNFVPIFRAHQTFALAT